VNVREYQDKSNQIHQVAELQYMGGQTQCECMSEDVFRAAMGLKGQVVQAGGPLAVSVRQFGSSASTDVRMSVDVIKAASEKKA